MRRRSGHGDLRELGGAPHGGVGLSLCCPLTTPRGLVAVTGGSGYIAGYCIAQLLSDGWRVRTTVRNLGRAEEVRATIGKIAPNAGAIEFVEADLNSDGGWADAVTGADYVLHVASPVPAVDPKSPTMNWFDRRAMERFACSRPRATRA